MTKHSDLFSILIERFDLPQAEAERFVGELFGLITQQLELDQTVKVKGLGTFKLVEMRERESIDVNTGERITIESRPKVQFTPEPAVRDRVNSPFNQFESIDLDDDMDFSDLINTAAGTTTQIISPTISLEEPIINADESNVTVEQPMITIEQPVFNIDQATFNMEQPMVTIEDSVVNMAKNGDGESGGSSAPAVPAVPAEPVDDETALEIADRTKTIVRVLYFILFAVIAGFLVIIISPLLKNGARDTAPTPRTEELVADSIAPADSIPAADLSEQEPADTIPPAVSQHPEPQASTPSAYDRFNSDARIKNGAYAIVGHDTTVRVLPQQTFAGICKAHLGPGMESYVVVYNDGKNTAVVGDTIRIPKLKTKKQIAYERQRDN